MNQPVHVIRDSLCTAFTKSMTLLSVYGVLHSMSRRGGTFSGYVCNNNKERSSRI